MKTKQRILTTCLALFNEEGEQNVSTVDIANELDISPGNLYYHYKGKEPIIQTLFDQFESEYAELLASAGELTLNTEQSWRYLYLLFEEIYQFRFFFNNIHNLLQRIPALQRRFKKLLGLQQATMELLLLSLLEQDRVRMTPEEVASVSMNLSVTLTHWLSHNQLLQNQAKQEQLLHQGVYQILSLIDPYLTPESRRAYEQARNLLKRTLN